MTDEQVNTLGGYILWGAVIIAIALSPPFSATTNFWLDAVGVIFCVVLGIVFLGWLFWSVLLKIAEFMEPVASALSSIADGIGSIRVLRWVRIIFAVTYAVIILGGVATFFADRISFSH